MHKAILVQLSKAKDSINKIIFALRLDSHIENESYYILCNVVFLLLFQ
jgi:hypothetical protein